MLIHEVRLRNIRSYEEVDISFDEGITLLSGDIGAGKSTILQAIEFALFGIQRGGLEGEGLLRHGTNDGSVAVTFTIDNEEFTVERFLKRTSQGVRQTNGTLRTNGSVTEYSAQELKASILKILGYPEQLVTKSKGLIFRHTVYTPQEEMKHILFMPAEERLNTLRTLFGIDTYRTIKENTQLLLRELRSQEKLLVMEASSIPSLTIDKELQQEQSSVAEQNMKQAEQTAKQATAAVHLARQALQQARQAADYALSLEHQRIQLTSKARELERSKKNTFEDIDRIEQYLSVAVEAAVDHTATIDDLRIKQQKHDEELLKVARELAALKGQRSLHQKHEHDITSMHECPVCTQTVGEQHKTKVHAETARLLAEIDTKIHSLQILETDLQAKRSALRDKSHELTELQKRFAAYQREVFVRKDQERQKHLLIARQSQVEQELKQTMAALEILPATDPAARETYNAAQQHLAQAEQVMHEHISLLGIARDAFSQTKAALTVTNERLERAKQSQERAGILQSQRQWLEDQFLELVQTIESHVLASIHAEFRELFAAWFGKLIEDETITVSIGEQFEPVVSQNGYDASLEQLSGGEKTAVALSYRLSLFKVVSDFISTVRTKDLLLLDEPTDGFSAEQLDRVRDVLRELSCRQIILVSHEAQMESGSDQVIRVTKRQHRSALTA